MPSTLSDGRPRCGLLDEGGSAEDDLLNYLSGITGT